MEDSISVAENGFDEEGDILDEDFKKSYIFWTFRWPVLLGLS